MKEDDDKIDAVNKDHVQNFWLNDKKQLGNSDAVDDDKKIYKEGVTTQKNVLGAAEEKYEDVDEEVNDCNEDQNSRWVLEGELVNDVPPDFLIGLSGEAVAKSANNLIINTAEYVFSKSSSGLDISATKSNATMMSRPISFSASVAR